LVKNGFCSIITGHVISSTPPYNAWMPEELLWSTYGTLT